MNPAAHVPLPRLSHYVAVAFTTALGVLPVLLLITHQGGSAAFHLTVLLSIALLWLPAPAGMARVPISRWLAVGMAVLLVAVLASLAVNGLWKGSEVEKAARLLLTVLILAAALRVPQALLARALLGVLPAIWVAAITIAGMVMESGRRPDTWQFNTVTYGNLTLLLAAMSLLLMGLPLTRFVRTEKLLKLVTGLLGVVIFIWTQTRGGLLAVPCFLLMGMVAMRGRLERVRVASVAALVVLAMIWAAHDGALKGRITVGMDEYAQCSSGHLADTSICIRLQLWRAALHMAGEAPLFGVGGGDRFRAELAELASEGKVTAFVAAHFGEAHNDFLYFLAAYGMLGALGLILVYLSPALLLLPRLRHGSRHTRLFAACGLSLCCAFAVFGITEMMLRDMRMAAFYAAWVAMMLALSRAAADPQATASAAR